MSVLLPVELYELDSCYICWGVVATADIFGSVGSSREFIVAGCLLGCFSSMKTMELRRAYSFVSIGFCYDLPIDSISSLPSSLSGAVPPWISISGDLRDSADAEVNYITDGVLTYS